MKNEEWVKWLKRYIVTRDQDYYLRDKFEKSSVSLLTSAATGSVNCAGGRAEAVLGASDLSLLRAMRG